MPAMICSSWHTGPIARSTNKRKNTHLDRVINQKSRVIKRISKKDSALVRHLAWLRELQESKNRLNDERRLEEERKLERDRLIRENRHNNTRKLIRLASQEDSTDKKAEKPAWCQSEKQIETVHTKANDENAILDFIDQLNFEQYNEDLELQTLIGQVKDRIKSLEKEKRKDEKLLQACTDVSTSSYLMSIVLSRCAFFLSTCILHASI